MKNTKLLMLLLSCVMVSVSAHGPWDNVSLSLLSQVQKPTALHNGVATLEMSFGAYLGYKIADKLTPRTLNNKLPYKLTGAVFGGLASQISQCKPFVWTLGLGVLGYKFRAPLYNFCAWAVTKKQSTVSGQNQHSEVINSGNGVPNAGSLYPNLSEFNRVIPSAPPLTDSVYGYEVQPSAPVRNPMDMTVYEVIDFANGTGGYNPDFFAAQNDAQPSAPPLEEEEYVVHPSAPALDPMNQTVYGDVSNPDGLNPNFIAEQQRLLLNVQHVPVNSMEKTVFGADFDPENLTPAQRLEALLRERQAGIISQDEFNKLSVGLIK